MTFTPVPTDVATLLSGYAGARRRLWGDCRRAVVPAARVARPVDRDPTAPARLRPYPSHEIVAAVAAETGLTIADLGSMGRTKHLADARHVAMFLMRAHTILSSSAIGHILSRRDHTTVLHAVARVEWEWKRLGPLVARVRARLGVEIRP